MNYSKNLRKSAMAKRVLILLGVAFCVGLAVGGVSVYALKTHITAKDKEKSIERTLERDNTETLVYGAYDDRTFTQEISLDWGAGDLDFTPLDCKMPEEQQEFTYYLCTGVMIFVGSGNSVVQQISVQFFLNWITSVKSIRRM